MTEAEWLACTDPEGMLEFLGGKFLDGKASTRKLRLFTCACCRRIGHVLTDERSRRAVEVVEKYADGLVSEEEKDAAMSTADQARQDFEREHPECPGYANRAESCGRWAAYYLGFPYWGAREAATAMVWERMQQGIHHRTAKTEEETHQGRLLHDVFGNPFRPVTLDPSWHTPSVVHLAQGIYDNRAFDRLPALADALEQAGCTNTDLLTHCRGPGEHVRGCWVVDLLLGKD